MRNFFVFKSTRGTLQESLLNASKQILVESKFGNFDTEFDLSKGTRSPRAQKLVRMLRINIESK